MPRALPFLLLLSLVLCTGCDPISGVNRRARVSFMPQPARVGTVIRATPGVDDVQYRSSESGRRLTLTGLKPGNQIHTFYYRGGSNVHGTLQFFVDYKQGVEFSHTLERMGRRPPQDWIDATRPVMVRIEAQLEATCGLTNLPASVVERCIGVKCK